MLIALLDTDHGAHHAALRWFADNASQGWASCPLTQNGCLRIMSLRRYANPLPLVAVAARLRDMTAEPVHEFWPDDVSLLDGRAVDTSRILSPGQLTDVYLLALAVSRGGRLVTLDQSVSLSAVHGATPSHLVKL
jgi:uncharacterized protein